MTDTEFESRTAELEAASSDLSREMATYWSTNPELRIKVAIEPETVRQPNGQTTVVRYLNFRVEDRKHDFTNNFSLRPSGYQWFFSFLAEFSEFEDHDSNVVILLDEPALTLHAGLSVISCASSTNGSLQLDRSFTRPTLRSWSSRSSACALSRTGWRCPLSYLV